MNMGMDMSMTYEIPLWVWLNIVLFLAGAAYVYGRFSAVSAPKNG